MPTSLLTSPKSIHHRNTRWWVGLLIFNKPTKSYNWITLLQLRYLPTTLIDNHFLLVRSKGNSTELIVLYSLSRVYVTQFLEIMTTVTQDMLLKWIPCYTSFHNFNLFGLYNYNIFLMLKMSQCRRQQWMQNVISRMSAAAGGGQIRVMVVLCYCD